MSTVAVPALHQKPKSKYPAPAGHDAVLNAIQRSGREISLVMMQDGSIVTGKLVTRDQYTLTVQCGTRRQIFFKHALESFYSTETQDAQTADQNAV